MPKILKKNIEKKIDKKNVKIYSKLKIHRQKKLNKEKEIKAHKKYYFKYFIWSPIISMKKRQQGFFELKVISK